MTMPADAPRGGFFVDAADLQRDLRKRGLCYLDGAIARYPEATGTAEAMLREQNDNA